MSSNNLYWHLILWSILALGVWFVVDYYRYYDGKLHVVYCSVGQGDAVLVRTSTGKTTLIDGGPDKAVLECLRNHLPFWQRDIDLVLLTHPHDDHFFGLNYVTERYTVHRFVTEKLRNTTDGFISFVRTLSEQRIGISYVFAGDSFSFQDGATLDILAPSTSFLARTSPQGIIGERGEFASLIIVIQYGNFSMLLTGDSQALGIQDAMQRKTLNVNVLQLPHHGSRTGLTSSLVSMLDPELAVVSVGKNNYGHPHPTILHLLANYHIPVLRTDKEGDIEIVSDGVKWWVVRNKAP